MCRCRHLSITYKRKCGVRDGLGFFELADDGPARTIRFGRGHVFINALNQLKNHPLLGSLCFIHGFANSFGYQLREVNAETPSIIPEPFVTRLDVNAFCWHICDTISHVRIVWRDRPNITCLMFSGCEALGAAVCAPPAPEGPSNALCQRPLDALRVPTTLLLRTTCIE